MLPHIGQGFAATGGGDSPAAVRRLACSPAIYTVVAPHTHTLPTSQPRPRPRPRPGQVRYFVQSIASLPQQLGLPTRLSQVGVTAADLEHLAEEAMQQTRLLPNNPREVLLDDARQLYEAAL